jgi:hypothetical protein
VCGSVGCVRTSKIECSVQLQLQRSNAAAAMLLQRCYKVQYVGV